MEEKYRLLANWRQGSEYCHCCLPVSRWEKVEDVLYAYTNDGALAGMFDLGAVDVLYFTQAGAK